MSSMVPSQVVEESFCSMFYLMIVVLYAGYTTALSFNDRKYYRQEVISAYSHIILEHIIIWSLEGIELIAKMPRLPLHHASGTGVMQPFTKVIRFVRYGCANRPFYHIVVMNSKLDQRKPPIEQLGSYDIMANKFNERLIALNLERIQYWLGNGVEVSKPVAKIFGLAGLFPIHPKTYMEAWRNRRDAKIAAEQAESETTEAAKSAG